MIAVIFEVEPAEGQFDGYLTHAARLKPLLEQVPGFISVERLRSRTKPDKLLSLSFWEDNAAVACWRIHEAHRTSQAAGRAGIFVDYRLRMVQVLRDCGMHGRREQAPDDSLAAHGW